MSDKRHDVHQLAITALSPLHIGTGQDLEPTSYVIDGEDLYLFSPEAALRALPEPARAELADLAEEIHGYIGWPASKKKQARKDQIAAIRAKA